MSKIFEALHKSGSGESLADMPMPDLSTEVPDQHDQPAVESVEPPSPPVEIRELALRLTGAEPVLPFEDGNAGEQYRLLRTKILHHPLKPRAIVVSSAGPGDGKSITAINLAGTLALKGTVRVALIDADFRRSSVSRHLGLPETPGLAEVLEGTCELSRAVIQIAEMPTLHIIPAGVSKLNPAELLDSPQWRSVCLELRKAYDYLIFDSPPIAAVADYDLLAAASDGVLLVVRPDHTNRTLCLDALKSVPNNKCLGVVLNCVPKWFLNGNSSYKSYYHK